MLEFLKDLKLHSKLLVYPLLLTNITNTVLLCCRIVMKKQYCHSKWSKYYSNYINPDATNSHNPFLYCNTMFMETLKTTATSNVTKITIPHYASDLYYYCNQHPNKNQPLICLSNFHELMQTHMHGTPPTPMPLLGNKDV